MKLDLSVCLVGDGTTSHPAFERCSALEARSLVAHMMQLQTVGAVIGGASACYMVWAVPPLREVALPPLMSICGFVLGCGTIAVDLLWSIPLTIGSLARATGLELAHALPRLLKGLGVQVSSNSTNDSAPVGGSQANPDPTIKSAPLCGSNPSVRKPGTTGAKISDWGGLSSPSSSSDGASDRDVLSDDLSSESDDERLQPARTRSQQEAELFMHMGHRFSSKQEYDRCQKLLDSNSRRREKKERAAAPTAVDPARLLAAVQRIESLNFEGEGEEPPIRRKALRVLYSVGTRAGYWRDVFPFESTGSYFRALETADFEMATCGRRVTKYLFKHVSDFADVESRG